MNSRLQDANSEQKKALETFQRDIEEWAEKGSATAQSELRVC